MTDARALAVSENLVDQFRLIAATSKVTPLTQDGVIGYRSQWAFPLFNAFAGVEHDDETWARALVQEYVDRGLPFLWWSTPSHPSAAMDRARRDAGAHVEVVPGMHRPLHEDVEVPAVAGLELEDVTDATFPAYFDVIEEGFGFEHWAIEVLASLFTELDPSRARHVLGRVDGTPVAAGTVFVHNDVAGLYNITTLEPARGRGIGRAVTQRLLQVGREMGCTQAVLHSSEDGFGVYERAGFETVGDCPQYVWIPG